jgi:hypothetical protein
VGANPPIGAAQILVESAVEVDRYLYVLVGAKGGDPWAEATFGGATSSSTSVPSADELDGDYTMNLFRIMVPAGTTGSVVFNLVDNNPSVEESMLAIGGISIQRMPNWGSCTLPAGFDWANFLTSEGSDDIARSPYFQQFQFRALLNSINLSPTPPAVVSDFDKGRLTAAYCEAIAWPAESTTTNPNEPPQIGVPSDPSSPPLDTLHPDQNGYGTENQRDSGDPWQEETDEDGDTGGDENGTQSEKFKLHQPMIKLVKRAFTCDGAITDPSTLVDTDAERCDELAPGVTIEAGTTVYWLFTVENIGLFGKFQPPEKGVADDVPGTSTDVRCPLTWARTATSPAETYAEVTDSSGAPWPTAPIWPGQARACFYSGVVR